MNHRMISITLTALGVCLGAQAIAQNSNMSFFITSAGTGNGADLAGLSGADMHCAVLAQQAGVTGKTWAAYLSTQASNGVPAVNARDRIGTGPWFNANGAQVAANEIGRAHV